MLFFRNTLCETEHTEWSLQTAHAESWLHRKRSCCDFLFESQCAVAWGAGSPTVLSSDFGVYLHLKASYSK